MASRVGERRAREKAEAEARAKDYFAGGGTVGTVEGGWWTLPNFGRGGDMSALSTAKSNYDAVVDQISKNNRQIVRFEGYVRAGVQYQYAVDGLKAENKRLEGQLIALRRKVIDAIPAGGSWFDGYTRNTYWSTQKPPTFYGPSGVEEKFEYERHPTMTWRTIRRKYQKIDGQWFLVEERLI